MTDRAIDDRAGRPPMDRNAFEGEGDGSEGGAPASGDHAAGRESGGADAASGRKEASRTEGQGGKGRRCPICSKPTATRFRPFCSKRCADVDLNRWLGGHYAIPAVDADLPDGEDLEGDGNDGGRG